MFLFFATNAPMGFQTFLIRLALAAYFNVRAVWLVEVSAGLTQAIMQQRAVPPRDSSSI